ncbi:spore germination protein [Virgibacillus ihumii]|uniref:spore germination protein n=1 Tax=Virgibacillus ihumii TaxID=2686091 RepID=UPI00157E1348|nr:spore germination protein [Virgibacillus ihumii]
MKKKREERKKFRELKKVLEEFRQNDDFVEYSFEQNEFPVTMGYLKTSIDMEKLEKFVMPYLQQGEFETLEEIDQIIPVTQTLISDDVTKLKEKLIQGNLVLYPEDGSDQFMLVPIQLKKSRQISSPEVEFSVVGPKEAFIENIDTNLNLVKKRLTIPELDVQTLSVGTVTNTKVAVVSIKGIADEENVNTAIQRISDLNIDQVIDSSYIHQMIADNKNSPFPQLLDTERPDRIAAVLVEGKVAIFVDGSPHVLIGPTTLVEFFSAFEDYFLNWTLASSFRMIRLFAVFFSILVTPLYVAVLTHHFEVIPKALLGPLISSRTMVPFQPVIEAVLLELTIELLREAGARLPTKIGQTIGIVGGIVIGTAAVEAGMTSNVLLILVALAALGSFTTPVYQMGNTIRLIRFPLLLVAHVYGMFGIAVAIAYIMVHLLKLTSLGRPFLEPIFPFRYKDLKDAFIRLPFDKQNKRPFAVRPTKINRPSKKE